MSFFLPALLHFGCESAKFLHDQPSRTPVLIKAALAHVQFETIHPFLDGNGRLGRLLITLILCAEGALAQPLLYLSLFFKQHRQEYYDRLDAVRLKGDWLGWLRFFLEGVEHTAQQAALFDGRLANVLAKIAPDLPEGHCPVFVTVRRAGQRTHKKVRKDARLGRGHLQGLLAVG
jgi:hypothetical protein